MGRDLYQMYRMVITSGTVLRNIWIMKHQVRAKKVVAMMSMEPPITCGNKVEIPTSRIGARTFVMKGTMVFLNQMMNGETRKT